MRPKEAPMILLENPEKFAEYRECDGEKLDWFSTNGWVIVALLSSTEIEIKSVNISHIDPSGYHTQGLEDRPFPFSKPRYLMGKARDRVLEELRETNESLLESNKKHSDREKSHQEELQRLEKLVDSGNQRFQGEMEKANQYWDQKTAADKRARKMEEDLAKLRTAIGDLKFKEIVES